MRFGLLALIGAVGCSQTTGLLAQVLGSDASAPDGTPVVDAPGETSPDLAPLDAPDAPDAPDSLLDTSGDASDAGIEAPGSDASAVCSGGAVHLGGPNDSNCAGAVASRFGRYALCTCGGLTIMNQGNGGPGTNPGNLSIQVPVGGDPGAVGAEGQMLIFGATTTDGTLVGSASSGIGLAGGTIAGNVHSAGAIGTLSTITVQGDVFSAAPGTGPSMMGPYVVVGPYTIGGTLHVVQGAQVDPAVVYEKLVHETVTVAPPCGCGAGNLFDIARAVSNRRNNNDNDSLSIANDFSSEIASSRSFDIPCGQYYLTGIRTGQQASIEIRVHGHVGVFVDGDVVLGGNLVVTPDDDAELDLVIAGALNIRGGSKLGAPSAAARTRGGTTASNTISLGDQYQLSALVYAPSAAVSAGVGLSINGSLFARTLSAGDVKIAYDPAAATGGQSCGVAPQPVIE